MTPLSKVRTSSCAARETSLGVRKLRARQGFTMIEMIGVVTLLIIIMGFAFVNFTDRLRSIYQMEVDQAAKEIYVAAQNHLTIAESTGQLKDKKGNENGEEGADILPDGVHYVLYTANSNRFATASSDDILPVMLPFGSIDDTVRLGGSYIIRYQYQSNKGEGADSAVVLDVFYANPNGSSSVFGRYDYTFTEEDYAILMKNTAYRQTDEMGRQARRFYPQGTDGIIGYYGGDEAHGMADAVTTPKIRVENAERLSLIVTNSEKFDSEKYKLELYVTGVTSGIQYGPIGLGIGTYNSKLLYNYVLDSVTDSGKHFAQLFPQLIPGEDIKLQVFAMAKATTLADSGKIPRVARSARVTTNSLFGALTKARTIDNQENTVVATDAHGNARRMARISNIRHLENLSTAISGFSNATAWQTAEERATSGGASSGEDVGGAWRVASKTTTASNRLAPESAYQSVDLDWQTFATKVGETLASVQVYSKTSVAGNAGSFIPIDPIDSTHPLLYDGDGHRIRNVHVTETASDAGLFSQLTAGSEVSDLELVNFKVSTTNGDAGALAGRVTGATITGVVAYNKLESGSDAEYEVRGSGAVGGLVGTLAGTSTLKECGAALYVRSTAAEAGGLVGTIAESATANITSCYAGGHTVNGDYLQVKEGDAFVPVTTDGAAGRMNVRAAAAAGGLVGSIPAGASATIKYSYSTASAYSYATASEEKNDPAGGLVGSARAGTITSCYATGLVASSSANDAVGAFAVLSSESSATITDSFYFKTINGDLPPIAGNAAASGITAFDTSHDDYRAMEATKPTVAVPYDKYDATNKAHGLPPKYPFKSALELNPDNADRLSSDTGKTTPIHYGDWPQPETLFLNTKPSS